MSVHFLGTNTHTHTEDTCFWFCYDNVNSCQKCLSWKRKQSGFPNLSLWWEVVVE